MRISDDDALMIAGRVFDAIEKKGVFNAALVADEVKAGLALVQALQQPLLPPPTDDGEATLRGYRRGLREARDRFVAKPMWTQEADDIERALVKGMQDLLGMPLTPAGRDAMGTGHYRLPATRKS